MDKHHAIHECGSSTDGERLGVLTETVLDAQRETAAAVWKVAQQLQQQISQNH